MPEVTGYTTDKVDELLADLVVGGSIDTGTGTLILTTKDGGTVNLGLISSGINEATTTVAGVIQLATDVETQAGVDSSTAVTPFSMASVVASSTARGLVELATDAETITATDAARSVTPASLKAVRVVASAQTESTAPTSYPVGTSVMALTTSAWSLNSGTGLVVTDVVDGTHAEQTFYATAGGTNFSQSWTRTYNTADGGGGWTGWRQNTTVATLNPTSFTQTTAFTSYPLGSSRLYFSTSNASSWDFTGKAGEVITFRDGTDFAVQTWRWHNSGTANATETWSRTANAASGWTKWTKLTVGVISVKNQSIAASTPGLHNTVVVTLPGGRTMGDANYVVDYCLTERNDGAFGSGTYTTHGAQALTATTFGIQYTNDWTGNLNTFISYTCTPVQG